MYMCIRECVCTCVHVCVRANKPAESAFIRTGPSALDNKYGCSFSFFQESLRSLVTCSSCLCGNFPLPRQHVFGYCHCSNVVYVAISRRESFKADFVGFWLLQSFCTLFWDSPWSSGAGAVGQNYLWAILWTSLRPQRNQDRSRQESKSLDPK